MHTYNVHEALYLNCEIHAPWVTGVHILGQGRKIFSLLPYIFGKKLNAWLWCLLSPFLNCKLVVYMKLFIVKFMPLWSGFRSGKRERAKWPHGKSELYVRHFSSFSLSYLKKSKWMVVTSMKHSYLTWEVCDPCLREFMFPFEANMFIRWKYINSFSHREKYVTSVYCDHSMHAQWLCQYY